MLQAVLLQLTSDESLSDEAEGALSQQLRSGALAPTLLLYCTRLVAQYTDTISWAYGVCMYCCVATHLHGNEIHSYVDVAHTSYWC